MHDKNRKYLWSLIKKQGDYLKNKLSYHPMHPKGRNAYAHICSLIKKEFKCSYKDISNDKIEILKDFIVKIKD